MPRIYFIRTAMKIHLSSAARDELDKLQVYHTECRGAIQVKGKGLLTTYFLTGKDGFDRELPSCDEYPVSPSDTISPTSPTPSPAPWIDRNKDNGKEKKTSILEITSL